MTNDPAKIEHAAELIRDAIEWAEHIQKRKGGLYRELHKQSLNDVARQKNLLDYALRLLRDDAQLIDEKK